MRRSHFEATIRSIQEVVRFVMGDQQHLNSLTHFKICTAFRVQSGLTLIRRKSHDFQEGRLDLLGVRRHPKFSCEVAVSRSLFHAIFSVSAAEKSEKLFQRSQNIP